MDCSTDWTQILNLQPRVVQVVEKEIDIIQTLAKEKSLNIRGRGHSEFGQVLTQECLLVGKAPFYEMKLADNNMITVSAFNTWREIAPFLKESSKKINCWQYFLDFTVGGSVAVGAGGVDAFANGTICDQINKFKVVLPNGKVKELTKDEQDFKFFMGSVGQLGVFTEIQFNVFQLQEYRNVQTVVFSDFEKLSFHLLDLKLEDFVELVDGIEVEFFPNPKMQFSKFCNSPSHQQPLFDSIVEQETLPTIIWTNVESVVTPGVFRMCFRWKFACLENMLQAAKLIDRSCTFIYAKPIKNLNSFPFIAPSGSGKWYWGLEWWYRIHQDIQGQDTVLQIRKKEILNSKALINLGGIPSASGWAELDCKMYSQLFGRQTMDDFWALKSAVDPENKLGQKKLLNKVDSLFLLN